jgi:hypothetical protein
MMAEIIHMSQQFCVLSRDGGVGQGWRFECLAPPQQCRNRFSRFLLGFAAALLAHGFAIEFDAIRVMNQPVENAIGEGRIADLFMPMNKWQLRGQDHRPALIPVIAKLQEIASFAIFQGSHGEVVEDQDVNARELSELAAKAPVDMRDSEVSEQLSGPFVQNREAIAAGFLCECTT